MGRTWRSGPARTLSSGAERPGVVFVIGLLVLSLAPGVLARSPQEETGPDPAEGASGDPLPPQRMLQQVGGRLGRDFRPLQFSPDGGSLAGIEGGRFPAVVDTETGEVRRIPHKSNGTLSAMVFSPDGRTLALGAYREVVLWDLQEDREIHRVSVPDPNRVFYGALEFSPDGTTLAIAGSPVCVWNIGAGDGVRQLGRKGVSLAFALAGKVLVSGDGDWLSFWDPATGEELQRTGQAFQGIRCTSPNRHAISASPDGKLLATIDDAGTFRLIEAATAGVIKVETRKDGGPSLARFLPDGNLLTTREGKKGTRIEAPLTGAEVSRLAVFNRHRRLGPVSPTLQMIATAGKLWKFVPARIPAHRAAVSAVAMSPDGGTVASGGWDNDIALWDTETGVLKGRGVGHEGWIHCLAFSRERGFLASGGADGDVRLWNLSGGMESQVRWHGDGPVRCVAFTPDGEKVASGGDDGMVRLGSAGWGGGRAGFQTFRGHDRAVTCLALSPDGKEIASGSWDGTVRLWEVGQDKPARHVTRVPGYPVSMTYTDEGRTLTYVCLDASVHSIEVESGEARQLFAPEKDKLAALTGSPDGQLLAVAGPDGTIRILGVSDGAELGRFEGHPRGVTAMNFSLDGKTLVSGSRDHTLALWDLRRLRRPPRRRSEGAGEPGLGNLWEKITSRNAGDAYSGMVEMASAGKAAIRLLKDRAQDWGRAGPGDLEKWIGDLDDDDFKIRDSASRELRARGEAAEKHLRRALEVSDSPEQRARLQKLIDLIDNPLELKEGTAIWGLRVVFVLEMIGTEDARSVLREIASDSPARLVREDASSALTRLGNRP